MLHSAALRRLWMDSLDTIPSMYRQTTAVVESGAGSVGFYSRSTDRSPVPRRLQKRQNDQSSRLGSPALIDETKTHKCRD